MVHRPPHRRLLCRALLPILVALPAAAAEYKLVLEPEPGTSPPARVCLVTRAVALRGVQTSDIGPLARGAACPDGPRGPCRVQRGPPSARCATCPADPHPGCAARVETGRFPIEDYTAVCADDDTWPADGGTIYIAVESVEAENPPALFSLEVSGGRVRWSPTGRISQPSYRVVGGDFELGRLSWPRGDARPEWVTVPVNRRCRCTSVRQPTGEPVVGVRVGEQGTCHGEIRPDGTLWVEVPATAAGQVRTATVASAHSAAIARWTGRWPDPDQPMRLSRFTFDLAPVCTLPQPDTCPEASAPFTTCASTVAVDGLCRYACQVDPTAALAPPVELELRLTRPEVVWRQQLAAPGQRLRGELPADRRVLTVRLPAAAPGESADRVEAVTISRHGIQTNRLLVDGSETLYLPMAGLQCGIPLTVDYAGDRPFRTSTARVVRGGRVELPQPDRSAQSLRSQAGIYLGMGRKSGAFGGVDDDRATDDLVTLSVMATMRYHPFDSSWFGALRGGVFFSPNWLGLGGLRRVDEAVQFISADTALAGATADLLGGYVGWAVGGPFEVYGGVGVGGGYALGSDADRFSLNYLRLLTATLGARRPLTGGLSGWATLFEVRGMRASQDIPIALLAPGDGSSAEVILDVETGPTTHVHTITGVLGLDYLF